MRSLDEGMVSGSLALVVALALDDSGANCTSAAQDGGKVLRVHHQVYPDVVDPQKSSFVNEIDILALAYEGLTRLDTNQETVPAAAESWEYNDDATQITFHLRRGSEVQRRLAADRGELPLRRGAHLRPGHRGRVPVDPLRDRRLRRVRRACGSTRKGTPSSTPRKSTRRPERPSASRPLDDRTLQIDLTNPAPYFHTVAYMWVFYPVKQEIVDADPDNWWQTAENHIGNGPFTVTEHRRGSGVDLRGQRELLAGTAEARRHRVRLRRGCRRRARGLSAGDLDIVQLEPPQIPEVQCRSGAVRGVRRLPDSLDLQSADEPQPGAVHRPEGARGLRLRLRPRDLLRRGPRRRLHRRRCPGFRRAFRARSRPTSSPSIPRRRSQALAESSYGGPENLPEIELYYNSERSGATERAEWMAGQYRDILGIELHPRADRRHDADRAHEGQRARIRSCRSSAAGSRTIPIRRTG